MDSSGCVRVKDCLSLAKILLNEEKKKQEVDHLVAQKKTRYMTLPTPFPLHILYATVWVDEGGVPHFFPDVYDYQEES